MDDRSFEPLRLPSSPHETIDGYIRLEDALNQIGIHDHPSEWGRLPGWSQMPFSRSTKKNRRFARYKIRTIKGRVLIKATSDKIDLPPHERRACTQLYRKVRASIRKGFETGQLKGYAVHHVTGEITQIKAPAVWRKQTTPIFFVGLYVLRSPGAPDQVADVVVNADNFKTWVAAREKEGAKSASVAALKHAGLLISGHEQKFGYRITRDEAFKAVRDAAGSHVSERQFKALAWPRGRKAGRRKNTLRPGNDAVLRDLQSQLIDLFAGRPRQGL